MTPTLRTRQASVVVFLLVLGSVLISRALFLHYGRKRSASESPSRNSPFSSGPLKNPTPPQAPAPILPASPKPVDLTRLNPESESGVPSYGFGPADVSPETNAPYDPSRVGSEFFFLKERISTIEKTLGIKEPTHGRFR